MGIGDTGAPVQLAVVQDTGAPTLHYITLTRKASVVGSIMSALTWAVQLLGAVLVQSLMLLNTVRAVHDLHPLTPSHVEYLCSV